MNEISFDSDLIQVPFCSGREKPKINVPQNACDAHCHIFDPLRFPYLPNDTRNQPPSTVEAYKLLKKRLGITREVVVQPSAYGMDNRCTLDALKQLGESSRGIVVIDDSISDQELANMHKLGVRGVRFNVSTGGSNDLQMISKVSSRIHELGWHVQFWMSATDTVELKNYLSDLRSIVVLDHRGHLTQPEGIQHPAFSVICDLISEGKTWVKLSGLYFDSIVGDPTYADTVEIGKAFVEYEPSRLVWGTDWPHPTVFSSRLPWPDDAKMLDLLAVQAPDEGIRNQILVTNPEKLYGY